MNFTISIKWFSPVGFDLMEVDIHKLDARIDSTHVDKTDKVGKSFLELVSGVIYKRRRQELESFNSKRRSEDFLKFVILRS